MVNMNIVPNDILSVAKLFKRTLTHICISHTWAHTIASIKPSSSNRNTWNDNTHNGMMLMNEMMMLMLMWCKCFSATITLGCYIVEASGPGDLADGEREAVRRSHGTRDDDQLVRLESSMHTPYLARHCRRNMVGNLPRGMPKVVDYW